ncbi:MAG: hypothetical protein KGZ65_06745 [Sphingomonadales bacterium]|nr:hypothetical protein [Sphingomonadaceae bacterium]MBS3930916.1 hypothetical protein [Sphingomonadales bacterium]
MSDVRIKFVRDVPVDLDSLPKSARGQCLKMSPAVRPIVGANGQMLMPPSPPRVWHFPTGAVVQLNAERAAKYLETGAAEPYESHTGIGTYLTAEAEERKGAV